MKILSTVLGRTVLLKPTHEIAPIGGVHLQTIFDRIKQRYEFGNTPNVADLTLNPEVLQKDGYKFSVGKIMKSGRDYPIQDLVVLNDGIVCSADHTDMSEFLLDDLLGFLTDQFSFRKAWRDARKLFLSQVWVQFEKSPDGLLSKMEGLSRVIGDAQLATYGIESPSGVQLDSIGFDFDKTQVSPLFGNLAAFKIERKLRAPFSENVLFSIAPLRTTDHISVLEQIERIAETS
ncbi:MAG: hypothetical protein HY315_00845 [Acidobacteria bacterium]|nr:hypothetical protein [Acidobacteriota bacterium]